MSLALGDQAYDEHHEQTRKVGMSHDSRYETECPHGHGWYFYEDGCAVAGCDNAPPTEPPWAQYKGLTNEAAVDAWAADRRAEEAKAKVAAASPPPQEPSPPDLDAFLILFAKAVYAHGDWITGRRENQREAERLANVADRADAAVVAAYKAALDRGSSKPPNASELIP